MIQTVTGAISKKDLGPILMHEHVSCKSLSFDAAFGKKWLDKSKLKSLAVDTLKQTKEKYNLGLMVDGTPIDLGRDPNLLKEVSEFSNVKIVASTGFYHLLTIETYDNDADVLADFFINECENGICGTDIKPGILKCATGNLGITKDNQIKLSTMAIVQKKTDLPLYVHCEHYDDIAFRQLDILHKKGADAEKIIIGHTAIRPDADYLESILNSGCYICMDQCQCYPHNLKAIADALVKLCKKGYTNKILLSNDHCIHIDFGSRKTNGLSLNAEQHTEGLGYIFDKQYDAYISAGGNEKDWNTMLCKNPINVLDN